ncbi:MAG: TSUP family transporter [Litorimonas sp.]
MQTGLLIILAAGLCAVISGLFGMAGGLVFMGIIASLMSVSAAMVVHGVVQSVSNGSRSAILREHIRWDILWWQLLGALPAIALMLWVAFTPNKAQLFLALGLLPILLWLPKGILAGDAEKPAHAALCGAMVMGLNLSAGVAGPALDFFYVKTALTRKAIVATKAVTMFASHLVKIAYFGIPLLRSQGLADLPPIWVLALAIPAVVLGTKFGTTLLERFSDVGFRKYTRILVTVVGIVYVFRGLALLDLI